MLAASADLFRVRLPDSTMGFLPAVALEPLDRVGGSGTVSGTVALRDRPEVGGLTIAPVRAGQAVNVLGTFADHHLVRVTEGRTGWVPVGALEPRVTSGVVTDGR